MTASEAIRQLEANADPNYREGLKRYGILAPNAMGVRMPTIRKIGKRVGMNQPLAEELWTYDWHEAKHLAAAIANPQQITKETLMQWVEQIYSWDVCDHLCGIIAKTPFGESMAEAWIEDDVKRCGIVTLVLIVVHDKNRTDKELLGYLIVVEQHAWDKRNFVKKALNWLLRQVGKKNLFLNAQAVECAEVLLNHPDKSAQWIAKNALSELKSMAVQDRLRKAP